MRCAAEYANLRLFVGFFKVSCFGIAFFLFKGGFDASEDLGRTLDNRSDLLDGILRIRLSHVDHFDRTVFLDYQEADGRDGQPRAAACAVRVTDTIKVTDTDNFIQSTPDRSALWAAQTPQIFKADRYRQALAAHYGEFTDDCAMMEADGVRVKLVEGSYTNIKITTPTDLVIAQAFLTEGIL